MLERFILALLTFVLPIQFIVQPVLAASRGGQQIFRGIANVNSALNLVAAVEGNSQFSDEVKTYYKKHNLNLKDELPRMKFDGNRMHFEGLPEPMILGNAQNEFVYRGVSFFYAPKKSFQANMEAMEKVWGKFAELGWKSGKTSWLFGSRAHADVGPLYVVLGIMAGGVVLGAIAAVSLGLWGIYELVQHFRESNDPFQVTAAPDGTCSMSVKGMKLVLKKVNGKDQVEQFLEDKSVMTGELFHDGSKPRIVSESKDFKSLEPQAQREMASHFSILKQVCTSPENIKKFNDSARRVQDRINRGEIELSSLETKVSPTAPAKQSAPAVR